VLRHAYKLLASCASSTMAVGGSACCPNLASPAGSSVPYTASSAAAVSRLFDERVKSLFRDLRAASEVSHTRSREARIILDKLGASFSARGSLFKFSD